MTAELCGYLGGLTLRGGDHDGELFEVLHWERRFLRGAFGQDGDSAVSVSRGNGKSALVAAVASAVVDPDGPLTGTRREVICCAASFEQSRVIFEDVLAFLSARYDLRDRELWRKQDSANRAQLEHVPNGARVRCIGSDPANAHGLRPWLVLADEPAQWPSSTRDRMLAALRTGLGKVPSSRLIALGTRPADSGHWFASMLAGQCGYAQTHAAKPDDPPGHRRTWRKANPSLDHLPSLEARIRAEWAEAKRNPSLLPSFVSLRLNGGTADTIEAELIGPDVWATCERHADPDGLAVWGIDAGGAAAMSAVSAYWPSTGRLDCIAAFPGLPSLAERGLRDGVGALYADMARRGELHALGGHATDTAALLRLALARFGQPCAVVADRWRAADMRDALSEAGVRPAPFVERGMGWRDGGRDVDAFRRACARGRVSAEPSLLLRSALTEARVLLDSASNAKLSKGSQGGRRLRARDDAAAATILAVAEGSRRGSPSARRLRTALAR